MITATKIIRAQGRIMSVDSVPLGSGLTADTPAGATTLTVVNAVDYPKTGTVSLNGEVLDYTAVDDPAGTLTLAGVTTADAFEGDRVALWNADISDFVAEKRAIVQFDGDAGSNDPIIAVVAQNLVASLPEGIRSQVGESVIIEYEHGTWRVIDVLGTARIPLTGDLKVYDDVGTWRTTVGRQSDGTYTSIDVNAPPPPVPAAPTVGADPGVLVVSSYGTTVDGSDWPLDFARLEVHAGTTSGFDISAGSKVADWDHDGGSVTIALDPGTWYVVLVAVNTSGVRSDPSAEASADVAPVVTSNGIATYYTDEPPTGLSADDDGSLWYDTNAGNLPHRWDGSALAWTPVPFGGSALTPDAIDGKTITGAAISGGTIEVSSVPGTTTAQSFSGTTLPAGWANEVFQTLASVPGASVTSTGVPDGPVSGSDNGSALLVNLGPAGNADAGEAEGLVVTSAGSVKDVEVYARVYVDSTPAADTPAESVGIMLREDGSASIESGLFLDLGYQHPRVVQYVSGVPVTVMTLGVVRELGAAGVPPDALAGGFYYRVKLRVVGGLVQAKIWGELTDEPDWTSGVIHDVLDAGAVGVYWRYDGSAASEAVGQKLWFDEVDVTPQEVAFSVDPAGNVEIRRLAVLDTGETWHTVGAAGEPLWESGCSAQSEPVQFRLDASGNVWMRGRVALPAGYINGQTMFTLPPGYRHTLSPNINFAALQQDGSAARLVVEDNGQVSTLNATTWVSVAVGFSIL